MYFVFYLKVSHPSDAEFAMMPGGRYLKKLAVKFRLV